MQDTFSRRAAWAAVIGGIALPVYQFVHPARDAISILSAPCAEIHFFGAVVYMTLAIALVGIYTRSAEQLGRSGAFAFVAALAGTIGWIGVLLVDGYLNETLARVAPTMQVEFHAAEPLGHSDPTASLLQMWVALQRTPFGNSILLLGLFCVLFSVGYVAFARALWRSNAAPPMPAIMMMTAGLLIGPSLLFPLVVEQVGAILLGGSFAWLGALQLRLAQRFRMSSPNHAQ